MTAPVVFFFTCDHAGKADAREERGGRLVCNDCGKVVERKSVQPTGAR